MKKYVYEVFVKRFHSTIINEMYVRGAVANS